MSIGITSSHPELTSGDVHPDVAPYVRAVERAGGIAVLLRNDVDALSGVLPALSGIVLTGGVDVDPARYGGNPVHAHSQAGRYLPERDAFEAALAIGARERGIPILCICRGLQIANVAFGGTLVEDLREEFGARYTIEHRQTTDAGLDRTDYAPAHDVTLVAGAALAGLAGTVSFPTNSMHHQAIRQLAPGLEVAGHTADGVIEAVGAAFAHPFFVGVQWHPEELDDPVSRALFASLVAARR